MLNRVHTKMELEHRDRNEASAKAVGLTATCDAGEDINKIPIINWLWVSTEGAPCCSLLPLLPLNSPLSLSLSTPCIKLVTWILHVAYVMAAVVNATSSCSIQLHVTIVAYEGWGTCLA